MTGPSSSARPRRSRMTREIRSSSATFPALGAAVDQAGGPQLRNVGTIGGNVCNGVTSADSASTLLTLNALWS